MRFRAKRHFASAGMSILWLTIAGVWLVFWLVRFHSPRHSEYAFRAIFQAVLCLVMALFSFFMHTSIYWQLDDEGICMHKLWWTSQKTRWRDVTRIVSAWSSYYDLKIEYDRLGLGSSLGHIFANPADRDLFLAELRRYAPQAEFVDESSNKILTA